MKPDNNSQLRIRKIHSTVHSTAVAEALRGHVIKPSILQTSLLVLGKNVLLFDFLSLDHVNLVFCVASTDTVSYLTLLSVQRQCKQTDLLILCGATVHYHSSLFNKS